MQALAVSLKGSDRREYELGSPTDCKGGTEPGRASRMASLAGRIAYAPVFAAAATALVVICLLAAGILGMPAMTPEKPGSEPFRLLTVAGGPARAVIVLSASAVAAVLAALLPRLAGMLGRVSPSRARIVVAVELGLVLAAQVAFVASVSASDYMWGDSHLLRSWSVKLLADNPSDPLSALASWGHDVFSQPNPQVMDTAPAYLAAYPYQSGTLLMFIGLTRMFGDGAVMASQWINVAANMCSVSCIVWLAGRASGEERMHVARMAAGGLCLACAPLCLLSLYSYGNWLGLALVLGYVVTRVLAWDSGEAWGTRKVMLWVASVALLAAALAVKSTFVLFAIGCVAAEAIWALFARGMRPVDGIVRCGMGIAALLVALSLSKVPQDAVMGSAGIPQGMAVPSSSFVAMGLARPDDAPIRMYVDGSDSLPAPGWYDASTTRRWSDAHGGEEVQKELSTEAIRNETAEAGVPGMARRLLWKTATEWAQGDFQGFFLSACCVDHAGRRVSPLVSESHADRALARTVLALSDVHQLLVYLLAASVLLPAGVRMLRGKGRQQGAEGLPVDLLVTCVFFCGAGCYLLWEAKPVYAFPFFLLLVVPAAARIGRGWHATRKRERRELPNGGGKSRPDIE